MQRFPRWQMQTRSQDPRDCPLKRRTPIPISSLVTNSKLTEIISTVVAMRGEGKEEWFHTVWGWQIPKPTPRSSLLGNRFQEQTPTAQYILSPRQWVLTNMCYIHKYTNYKIPWTSEKSSKETPPSKNPNKETSSPTTAAHCNPS